MPVIFKLDCPSCGATLNIPDGLEKCTCEYCGSQSQVTRGGGIVELQTLLKTVSTIEKHTSRAADELSLARATKTLKRLERDFEKYYSYPTEPKKEELFPCMFDNGEVNKIHAPAVVATILFGLILWMIGVTAVGQFIVGTGVLIFAAFLVRKLKQQAIRDREFARDRANILCAMQEDSERIQRAKDDIANFMSRLNINY